MYALGVGFAPLVTSSFSEEFGRLLFYIISSLMFMLSQVMIALQVHIVSECLYSSIRIFQGTKYPDRLRSSSFWRGLLLDRLNARGWDYCRHMAASSVKSTAFLL